jgi:hypothetical protein
VSLSPRVRILAAALVVAVLALSGGFLLLGRGQSASNAAVGQITPLHLRKGAAAKGKQAARTAARRVPKRTARVRRRPTVVDGMPAALARALQSKRVVVVSLYAPRSSVDSLATEEARQGAALAGAGFVALNVAQEKVVSPLTALLASAQTPADRILDGPAVLVFQRPKALFVRLNGFADRDTVAQAAANAATLAR